MRIVKRPEFLKLPAGTLYSKYEPCVFGELNIKGDTLGNDWCYQQIADAIESTGEGNFSEILFKAEEIGSSMAMDFDCQGRDGCFESDEQMFAVWGRADVEALIARLQATLTG